MATTYTWVDAAHTSVQAVGEGGALSFITASPDNGDYQALVASGTAIGDYVAPIAVSPQIISDRQFFQQLATQVNPSTGNTYITQDEARAAMAAVIPQEMVTLINQLPAARQFPAQMEIMGSTEFDRTTALASTIAGLYGWQQSDIDALWTAAAAL